LPYIKAASKDQIHQINMNNSRNIHLKRTVRI
jgi:hypothetical protein